MSAREVVLERVRLAVADASPAPFSRRYIERGSMPHAEVVEAFVAIEFATTVRPSCGPMMPPPPRRRCSSAQGARHVGVPPDLDARRRPAGVELVEDDALSPQQLDELDGALTTCAAACAITGTIALDGGTGTGETCADAAS